METIRRDKLKEAVRAGKMVSIGSYHFDDMNGGESRKETIPARLSSGYDDFIEGQCNLRDSDFNSSCGRAWENPDGSFTLIVHSNCNYDLRLKPGETLKAAVGKPKGRLPHNVRMQDFLKANGIEATVKYFFTGTVRGWRLYNHSVPWTLELADKLTALGFTNYNGEPLGQYNGNGGVLSVFLQGHRELLNEPAKEAA